MSKWLVGASAGGMTINAVPFDHNNIPCASGILFFVLEADSEEEAIELGDENYCSYVDESTALWERHTEESVALNHKYKLLWYHE
jgi:hypothetical protein